MRRKVALAVVLEPGGDETILRACGGVGVPVSIDIANGEAVWPFEAGVDLMQLELRGIKPKNAFAVPA